MAEERTGVTTLKGNPLTMVGPEIKVGDTAPNFTSYEKLGSPVTLDTYDGKIKIFNVIVSVDTPVCDIQTKRFNQEAANLGDDVEIITMSIGISMTESSYSRKRIV